MRKSYSWEYESLKTFSFSLENDSFIRYYQNSTNSRSKELISLIIISTVCLDICVSRFQNKIRESSDDVIAHLKFQNAINFELYFHLTYRDLIK